jgi:hypothetical protein
MQAREGRKAAQAAADAAAFNPYAMVGPSGYTSISDGQMRYNEGEDTKLQRGTFNDMFANIAGGGGFNQEAANMMSQMGTGMLPGVFGGAMDASAQIPTGAFNAFTQNAMNNAAYGQNFGMGAMGQAMDFAGRQTGINEGQVQNMMSRGNQLMNQDYSQLAADQLARSRELARPAEERAVNAKFQNLFNRGVLSQTGGERQVGELALAQEQADIQRQFGADQFAASRLDADRNAAFNLFGQGFQGRGLDQQFNLGAAGQFANMGTNMLNFGAGQAGQGLGARVQMSDMINSRGQQRIKNVTDLLGFGQGINEGNINQMLGMFGAGQQLDTNARNWLALGINSGSAQSAAGAQQGNFMMRGAGSPFGSFLEGLGGGYMARG